MKMTFLNLFLVETAECTKGIAHLKMKTHVIIYTSSWCPKPYVEYQRKTLWGCQKQHVPLQNYKWVLDLCAWIPSLKTYHLYVRKKLKFYIHVCIHYILFLQKTLSLVHVLHLELKSASNLVTTHGNQCHFCTNDSTDCIRKHKIVWY